MAAVTASRRHRMSLTDDKLLEAIGIQKITVKGKSEEEVEEEYNDKFSGKATKGQDIKFFIPDKDFFTPMGKSKRGDWLAEHKESGQTYKQFITGGYRGPDKIHHTIYLAPVTFKEDAIPEQVLQPLKTFAEIFFGMKVNCMEERNLVGKVSDRLNDDIFQVKAGQILDRLDEKVPRDAFCVAGITMCDLYPKNEWNFVFGLARSPGRTGVYSLARYLTNFGESTYTQINLDSDPIPTLLVRACKTMCHEMGHMFGLRHCTHFHCLMNGSNHLEESDSRPSFLCPICLRKLHHVCKFDIIQRYKDMKDFWSEQGLKSQADWLERRLNKLLS
ncbi:archaemetzincin-2-like [Mercenaria mercenaria]|uniref:archaemetzincin-2-like n=1 Tax=Mercenaria mercenaria TaxID=6596 RepID=UPI00234E7365|nr:archaemetzincin-2-like [Mercenaria mercenaria]